MKGMQLILLLVIVVLLVCFRMGRGGIQLIRERGPNPVAAVGNHSSRVSDTAAPPARAEKTRHEQVVVVTKVHGHGPADEMLKQSLCLFTAAYNHRAGYDIVVFATELQHFSDSFVPELRAIVHPASLVLVPDARSLKEEVMALPKEDRALLLSQCNTTVDKITWFTSCSHTGRINYGWQAEFRSKQIWGHLALAKYRYMLWVDTDAFALQEWQQDPVDFLVRNNLVLLFDNWPQGNSRGREVQDRLQRAFGTTLCDLKLDAQGRFKVRTGDCRKSLPLVHGMLHVTDMDFYRSGAVQKFQNIWIGNGKFARQFDDQAAVTAPAVFLAPHRAADMYRSGIELGVFHNFHVDGKQGQTVAKWIKYPRNNFSIPNNTKVPQGFHRSFPLIADHFPLAKEKCMQYVKHGS